MPVVCSLQTPLTGVTVDPNTCVVTTDGTLAAGQYVVYVVKTNTDLDPTDPNYQTLCPMTITVQDPNTGGGGHGCGELINYVGCDGQELPQTVDVFGNPAVKVCPTIHVEEYSLSFDGEPDPSCCVLPEHDGKQAFETDEGCFSHLCYNGLWRPYCGGGGTVEPPATTQICYDVAGLGGSQWCFGGGATGWWVNGLNQHSVDCGFSETPATTFVDTVLVNSAWQDTTGAFPAASAMPGLLAGAVDSGQGSGSGTVISASGDPAVSPYFGAPRVMMFLDAGMDNQCVGPYTVEYTVQDTSGAIGFGLWDSNTNTLQDITGAGATGGTVLSFENAPGLGDWLLMDTSNGVAGFHSITFGNTGTVLGDGVYLVFTAMGGNDPNPVESIGSFSVGYTRTSGTNGCCECYSSLSGVAALLTQTDSTVNGQTWSVVNGQICADVPVSVAASYGDLVFCEGTVPPNAPVAPAAPRFTAVAADTCVDSSTGDVTICCECENGAITSYRWRTVSPLGAWNTIS